MLGAAQPVFLATGFTRCICANESLVCMWRINGQFDPNPGCKPSRPHLFLSFSLLPLFAARGYTHPCADCLCAHLRASPSGKASASQADTRGFESRCPLHMRDGPGANAASGLFRVLISWLFFLRLPRCRPRARHVTKALPAEIRNRSESGQTSVRPRAYSA